MKSVMRAAGIEGPQATPKGLLSKWMGHAAIETTAIYANALGEEQRSIAERMWR